MGEDYTVEKESPLCTGDGGLGKLCVYMLPFSSSERLERSLSLGREIKIAKTIFCFENLSFNFSKYIPEHGLL